MGISITIINAEMQSTNQTNIGEFPGSALRGALIQSMVYRNCESLRYGHCDKCKDTDCPLRNTFVSNAGGENHLEANPIIVNTDFVPDRTLSDRAKFSVILCGDNAKSLKNEITDILNDGIYLGSPKTKFSLTSLSEESDEVDLSILDKTYSEYSNTKIKIEFITPFLSKNKIKSIDNTEKFTRTITTRVTSMVRGLGIDYRVPYQNIIDNADVIKSVQSNLRKVSIQRKSTRTHKYQLLHGEIGEMVLEGDFSHIYPFIEIASKLSIGKECTMGFGQFKWEVLKNTSNIKKQ